MRLHASRTVQCKASPQHAAASRGLPSHACGFQASSIIWEVCARGSLHLCIIEPTHVCCGRCGSASTSPGCSNPQVRALSLHGLREFVTYGTQRAGKLPEHQVAFAPVQVSTSALEGAQSDNDRCVCTRQQCIKLAFRRRAGLRTGACAIAVLTSCFASLPQICYYIQVMLLSDGSVTRHLQLLTDVNVHVVRLFLTFIAAFPCLALLAQPS